MNYYGIKDGKIIENNITKSNVDELIVEFQDKVYRFKNTGDTIVVMEGIMVEPSGERVIELVIRQGSQEWHFNEEDGSTNAQEFEQ